MAISEISASGREQSRAFSASAAENAVIGAAILENDSEHFKCIRIIFDNQYADAIKVLAFVHVMVLFGCLNSGPGRFAACKRTPGEATGSRTVKIAP
jgi:hypothetical protein